MAEPTNEILETKDLLKMVPTTEAETQQMISDLKAHLRVLSAEKELKDIVIRDARDRFLFYRKQRLAKGTAKSTAKAVVNEYIAEMMTAKIPGNARNITKTPAFLQAAETTENSAKEKSSK